MREHRLAIVTFVLVLCTSGLAHAQSSTTRASASEQHGRSDLRLELFANAGFLSSLGARGVALGGGVRLGLGRYVALSFDLGYGLMGASPGVQDRWWLMPALAWVIPADPIRFDLGISAGAATASGYTDIDMYVRDPVMDAWALQLVPTLRGHAMAALDASTEVSVFWRLDIAFLLIEGNTLGCRSGNPDPTLGDTMWVNLSLGVAARVL